MQPSETADLDTAEATEQHSELIRNKAFLRNIYEEHYLFFRDEILAGPKGIRVELGSGGGFIKEVIPDVITSDVIPLRGVDKVMSATALPFGMYTVSAIMMVNVFHHIQDVRQFLREADRVLMPEGKVLMVEPANTLWSRLIYQNLHHEPFLPKATDWKLPEGGRMTSANDALPWIVFSRDREVFEREFPHLRITKYENFMPFRYLASGGVSKPQLLPNWSYPLMKGFESALSPINNMLGMFTHIVLEKLG